MPSYSGVRVLVTVPFPHIHCHSDCKKEIALVEDFSHEIALGVILEGKNSSSSWTL